MKHSTKSFGVIFAAASAIAMLPAFAEENDLLEDQSTSRQIVVQSVDQDEEISQLVAKLRESRDSVDSTTAAAPVIVEDDNTVVAELDDGVDAELFAPDTTPTVEKVDMPTIFNAKQIDLYNALTHAQQASLVKKLVKHYGYNTLYPSKVRSTYDNYRSTHSYKPVKRHSYHSGYTYKPAKRYGYKTRKIRRSYSTAYSTSNYHAKRGCNK